MHTSVTEVAVKLWSRSSAQSVTTQTPDAYCQKKARKSSTVAMNLSTSGSGEEGGSLHQSQSPSRMARVSAMEADQTASMSASSRL